MNELVSLNKNVLPNIDQWRQCLDQQKCIEVVEMMTRCAWRRLICLSVCSYYCLILKCLHSNISHSSPCTWTISEYYHKLNHNDDDTHTHTERQGQTWQTLSVGGQHLFWFGKEKKFKSWELLYIILIFVTYYWIEFIKLDTFDTML